MGEDGGKSQVGLHEQCVSRELTINSNGKQAERSGLGWERPTGWRFLPCLHGHGKYRAFGRVATQTLPECYRRHPDPR